MSEEVIFRRENVLARRLSRAPGEAMSWHRDPYHRITVVFHGSTLAIEYRDGSPTHRLEVTTGQVDWDEPTDRIHRAVNIDDHLYEEIAVFFLDYPDAEPQPRG